MTRMKELLAMIGAIPKYISNNRPNIRAVYRIFCLPKCVKMSIKYIRFVFSLFFYVGDAYLKICHFKGSVGFFSDTGNTNTNIFCLHRYAKMPYIPN